MRLDQYQKLQALQEKLYDAFIDEADPAGWPGRGLKLAEMDAKTRGDLYWCRKTAASVLVLANRVGDTIGRVQLDGDGPSPGDEQPADGGTPDDGDQVEDEIASYEKQAMAVLSELQAGSRSKAMFDKKVLGSRK